MAENYLADLLHPSNPLKIPVVIRALDIRDGKISSYDEGYAKDKICLVLEKLGDISTKEEIDKSFELASNWDKITKVMKRSDGEGHEILYQNRYDFGEENFYDIILQNADIIKIIPKKIELLRKL